MTEVIHLQPWKLCNWHEGWMPFITLEPEVAKRTRDEALMKL